MDPHVTTPDTYFTVFCGDTAGKNMRPTYLPTSQITNPPYVFSYLFFHLLKENILFEMKMYLTQHLIVYSCQDEAPNQVNHSFVTEVPGI